MSVPPPRTGLLTAAAVVLLLAAAPTPGAALATLRDAGSATEQTAPLLALVALAAWALAGWLAAAVALTAGAHLPGQAGAVLAPVARRTVPGTLRRAVEAALGLTVAVGVLASPASAGVTTPAAAAPAAAPATAAPDLDWGGTPDPAPDPPAAAPGPPDLAPGPSVARPASPAPEQVPAAAVRAPVVVRPGDTLWGLAEQDLCARGQHPSNAQVASAWPAWWAANREAVGADPHLIRPGTVLTPPAPDDAPPPR